MYFKMIANHPKYSLEKGGDLAFTSCTNSGGEPVPIRDYAFGDKDGNPVAQTGWYFFYYRLKSIFNVNLVQEACAKCFGVHNVYHVGCIDFT